MASLTIFLPFYNDSGTVEKMISDAYFFGTTLTKDLEIIAINDGSEDDSLLVLNKVKALHPDLKIINHEQNQGYGGALIDGIKNSTKEWVFYTDGDAQYHLDEIENFWKSKDNYDVVNGFKRRRADGESRAFIGHAYRIITKTLFNLPIKDIDCDYRLIKGDLLRSLDLQCKSGAITVEMIKKLALRKSTFIELPVYHYKRVYGKSMFFTPRRIWETIYDEVKLLSSFKKFK